MQTDKQKDYIAITKNIRTFFQSLQDFSLRSLKICIIISVFIYLTCALGPIIALISKCYTISIKQPVLRLNKILDIIRIRYQHLWKKEKIPPTYLSLKSHVTWTKKYIIIITNRSKFAIELTDLHRVIYINVTIRFSNRIVLRAYLTIYMYFRIKWKSRKTRKALCLSMVLW